LHRFYELTPRSFYNYLKGVRFRENENYKSNIESTRLIMWTNLLPHQKKGKKLKPTDVLAFPWESNANVGDVSKEEKQRLAKQLWAKVDANNKKTDSA
jgi:hypothetical protein